MTIRALVSGRSTSEPITPITVCNQGIVAKCAKIGTAMAPVKKDFRPQNYGAVAQTLLAMWALHPLENSRLVTARAHHERRLRCKLNQHLMGKSEGDYPKIGQYTSEQKKNMTGAPEAGRRYAPEHGVYEKPDAIPTLAEARRPRSIAPDVPTADSHPLVNRLIFE